MKRLSISKAWTETSAFLSKDARLVVPVALALLTLPSTLSEWLKPALAGNQPTSVVGLLLALIVLAAGLVGQVTISGLAAGWRGNVGEAISHSLRRVPAFFGAILLIFIPLALVGGVIFSMIFRQAGITNPAQLTPQAIAAMPNVGWLILLIVFVAVAISARLFPMAAVAFTEKLGVMGLIRRSMQLTRGHFLRLFGTLGAVLLAALFINTAVALIVGLLVRILAGGTIEPLSLSSLLIVLASALVSTLVGAVLSALAGRVYVQLATEPSVPSSAG